MSSVIRRFHPFKRDLAALDDPPFDPRKQSWALGALSALETVAGLILTIPLLFSIWGVAWWLSMSANARSQHHFHDVAGSLFMVGGSTVLAAALLWAGLSLMFGWRARYRAHGVLAVTVLAVAVAGKLLAIVLAANGN